MLQIKLERVLGLTVSSNAALDCDATSELVAYPAGWVYADSETIKPYQISYKIKSFSVLLDKSEIQRSSFFSFEFN